MKHKRMITLLLVLAMLLGILPVTAAAAAAPDAEGWLEQSKLHGYADSSESGRDRSLRLTATGATRIITTLDGTVSGTTPALRPAARAR